MRLIGTAMVACALLLGAGCANGVFYQPNHKVYQTPASRGLAYEAVTFTSADGTPLSGWFIPAVGPPIGTVIHFHGNAQNMTAHFSFVGWLPAAGFNVFVFDYRGYGQSGGKPERRGVYADGVAAIRYVAGRPDVDPQRLVVFAQSLGGANAIAVLARHPFPGVRAAAIESSFSSYRGIARDKIALIPVLSWVRWPLSFLVVGNAYSPDALVDRLPPIPLLFIHGTDDVVVPYRHSEILFARAHEPKTLWTVEHGRHTEAFMRFGSRYREPLVAFFAQALAGSTNAPAVAPAVPPQPGPAGS
ncbi:MAG: alpha/beta hydrolase [Lentisphaerae bacterium]|nr:alpha/beta hydrolase [Lentisphaerota bacterium]